MNSCSESEDCHPQKKRRLSADVNPDMISVSQLTISSFRCSKTYLKPLTMSASLILLKELARCYSSMLSLLCHLLILCGSLAQCALSLKRLSAEPGFNPQTRQNKLFQDYWRSCFENNFSDRQEGLMVSSEICDH